MRIEISDVLSIARYQVIWLDNGLYSKHCFFQLTSKCLHIFVIYVLVYLCIVALHKARRFFLIKLKGAAIHEPFSTKRFK